MQESGNGFIVPRCCVCGTYFLWWSEKLLVCKHGTVSLTAALNTLELKEMTKATSTASQVIIVRDTSIQLSNFLFHSPPDCMSREPFWVTREDAVILTTTLLC